MGNIKTTPLRRELSLVFKEFVKDSKKKITYTETKPIERFKIENTKNEYKADMDKNK